MSHEDQALKFQREYKDGRITHEEHVMSRAEMWEIDLAYTVDLKHAFPIPADCPGCRKFEAAIDAEPPDSTWHGQAMRILSEFRMVHHDPTYAFADRYAQFMNHAAELYEDTQMLKDLARLVVVAEQL